MVNNPIWLMNLTLKDTDTSDRMRLWILAVNGFSTYPKTSGLEPHYQMPYCVISSTLIDVGGRILILGRGQVSLFYRHSRLGNSQFEHIFHVLYMLFSKEKVRLEYFVKHYNRLISRKFFAVNFYHQVINICVWLQNFVRGALSTIERAQVLHV